ncbi:hypothetical protein RHMOL_Rhmol12G0066600 [Rhododendron molle]|uniref:Uncharacterized protein n=1 Tax=Rhododendron molle TaxID=49168 RepID=A0ACC0LGA5_RHOML|nr:hypothetical protein RHMOL_Rhmol12G0066600 [Rhododendron molle]
MRRFPYAILTSLSHPTTTTTALLRPLSTKPTTTANDEWNDAWESAWLPDDLSGQNRAPWESDVNFSLPHTPPTAAATDVDAETKAFVEDMTDNWEQRRKSPKTQQRQEKEEKLKEMEKSSLYSLESIKRDYRVQKQRIHAGLWVKEIEKQEEDKLGDGFGRGDGIDSLLDSCSEPRDAVVKRADRKVLGSNATGRGRPKLILDAVVRKDMSIIDLCEQVALDRAQWRIFDSPNNDLNNTKIPSSFEFKNKPDGWETTAKAQDGSVWEMSQREEDILIQEFERRIAFSKFQIASFIKTHIFSRRRPIDGWKYMIEEIGPNARKGKGSVSRLPSLSDASTQPFKEEKIPIASRVMSHKRR